MIVFNHKTNTHTHTWVLHVFGYRSRDSPCATMNSNKTFNISQFRHIQFNVCICRQIKSIYQFKFQMAENFEFRSNGTDTNGLGSYLFKVLRMCVSQLRTDIAMC